MRNKFQTEQFLKDAMVEAHLCSSEEDPEHEGLYCVYLGSVLRLDPCGRYHHFLSLGDVPFECFEYWAELEDSASNLNGFIEFGDDPLDVYFYYNG